MKQQPATLALFLKDFSAETGSPTVKLKIGVSTSWFRTFQFLGRLLISEPVQIHQEPLRVKHIPGIREKNLFILQNLIRAGLAFFGHEKMSRQVRLGQSGWKRVGALAGLMLLIWAGSVASSGVPAQAEDATTQRMTLLKQSSQRWIEINVATQRLIAWEGGVPIYAVVVSTGTDDHPTPSGNYAIQSKHRTARMRGDDYDVPDVPFTMYYSGNYAIHGAYWHRRFGTPVSHGCVNVAVDHAEWLFSWASIGTPVVVHF